MTAKGTIVAIVYRSLAGERLAKIGSSRRSD